MICSSIAMLQERFRQLEKVKEMREERELLKLISSVSSVKNNHQCNPCYDHHLQPHLTSNLYDHPNSKFLSVSEITFPTRPLDSQLLSLSLWPSSQTMKNNHADSYWDIKIENTQNLTAKPSWLNDVPLARPSLIKKMDESSTVVGSEVDTTLHL
ncbi:hypothetical protein L6452_35214 [Arctium lappa]|uniref:Uncharacterized protein n=1 Tax=Arctium lappa TaxID=4217 RepID=A0ACB8Y705_ARCLA|nr:hypothetical protein L6452_35214 [Arctium lappa]